MQNKKEILFLKPYFKDVVWGGNKLHDEFGYKEAGMSTGECWGISAHPNGASYVLTKPYVGLTLAELYHSHKELFGDLEALEFPLLVKILDTKEKLSIQVHPDDKYAECHAGAQGKSECWYIMDCPENATLAIGHHAKTREELTKLIKESRYDELIDYVPVKKGDFIQIEPGTIHAIGSGFTILETQQNSDTTYRVYDYNRIVDGKLRPLHVNQSIEVIKVPNQIEPDTIKHTLDLPVNQMNEMPKCSFCRIFKMVVQGQTDIEQNYPFLAGSILSGEGTIEETKVKKGDHFILPAGFGDAHLSGNMELIFSTI